MKRDVIAEGAPVMRDAAPQGSTLRGILTVAWYDRRRIGAALLIGLALTLVAALLTPRAYTSEASLLLRLGREYIYTPELGEPGTASGTPIPYDRDQSLLAESRILTSRDLKEALLKKLGVATIYPAIAAKGGKPVAQHDAAVKALDKGLVAELVKGSNLMQVSFKHDDPGLAPRLLQEFIGAYLAHRSVVFASAHYATALANFDVRKSELQAAEQRLTDAKAERRIRSFAEEQSLLLTQRNALDMRKSDLVVTHAQAVGRGSALRKSLPAVAGEVRLSSDTAHGVALENARKVLLDLRLKERDLATRYTDENDQVQDARAAVEATRQTVQDLQASPSVTVRTGRNPTQDVVTADLVHSLADQRQARSGDAAVAVEQAKVNQRLEEFAVSERQLPALERERRLAEQRYEAASKRLVDQTELAELDRQRQSNVSVVQSPSNPLDGKSMLGAVIGVGIALSLCLALLTAFLSALWRDTCLTADDVQRHFGTRPLATLSRGAA